jgi:Ca2+-binding RTX toxin-like protein
MADTVLTNLSALYPSGLFPLNTSSIVFFDRVHPTAQLHALAAAHLIDNLNGSSAGETIRLATPDMKLGGSIASIGEVDKLSFSLAANTTYTLEMLGISSGKLPGLASWQVLADPKLRLIGPNGSVQADDDGGLGLDARMQFTTAGAGTYTLELAAVGMLTGSYTLQAQNHGVANDTYTVTSGSTLVIEGPSGGTDQVLASISYALAAGTWVEKLSTTNVNGTTTINLTGNEMAQSVTGNAGRNVIDGGAGIDQLWGKAGADTFAFTSALNSGVDSIMDFNARDDSIRLENQFFTALPAGTLSRGAFHSGTAAHDADDRIIYDAASHRLYYDPDGTGTQAAIVFAEIYGNNLRLTNSDFVVV